MSHHGVAVKNHNIPHAMHASCTSIPFATQNYYMRYIRTIPIPGLERARVARVLAEYILTDCTPTTCTGPGLTLFLLRLHSACKIAMRVDYASITHHCDIRSIATMKTFAYTSYACCILISGASDQHNFPVTRCRSYICIHVTDISDCSSSTCSF